jgi:hypothetical protein
MKIINFISYFSNKIDTVENEILDFMQLCNENKKIQLCNKIDEIIIYYNIEMERELSVEELEYLDKKENGILFANVINKFENMIKKFNDLF